MNIAPSGDSMVFEWPEDVVNPATSDKTFGTATITGGTGRFEGVQGFLEWSSWDDSESGLRLFSQDGWITSVGSLKQN